MLVPKIVAILNLVVLMTKLIATMTMLVPKTLVMKIPVVLTNGMTAMTTTSVPMMIV
jgi:hypothetical protein